MLLNIAAARGGPAWGAGGAATAAMAQVGAPVATVKMLTGVAHCQGFNFFLFLIFTEALSNYLKHFWCSKIYEFL